MVAPDMIVSVFDGDQLLDERECRLARLPDGRMAAIFRGLAFPLLPSGNAIDVSSEAHSPAEIESVVQPRAGGGLPYAVIEGAEEAYVLVAGSAITAEGLAAQLRKAGLAVLRTGRHLGDSVDGLAADWFIRVAAPALTSSVREKVAEVLGEAQKPPTVEPNLRSRLLAIEMSRVRERALRAEAEVERLKLALAERASSDAEEAALRAAVEQERRRGEAAEADALAALASLDMLPTAAEVEKPLPTTPRSARRILDEISDVLAIFLPRIRLLRQTLDVIAIEFADRRALYRVLAELEGCGPGMPPRWKAVQGAAGWIEKSKVANGQDSQGRVYARLDREERRWDVLVSHKSEQERDIDWLRRR